jgi:hypothetical protein
MTRLLIIILLTAATGLAGAENLLRNGDFLTWAGGAPVGWDVGTGLRCIAESASETAPAAMRIDVETEPAEPGGAVVQRIAIPAGAKRLVLSGCQRATQDGVARFQVKLLRGGKEIRRQDAAPCSTAWQKVSLDIDLGEADEIKVLCRLAQSAKGPGLQVWFAAVQLVAP